MESARNGQTQKQSNIYKNNQKTKYGNYNTSPQKTQYAGCHTEENKHRQKEVVYWKISTIITSIAVVGAIASARFAYKALEAAERQLRLADAPKLRIGGVHIWQKGFGRIYDSKNTVPKVVTPQTKFEGFVAVINDGDSIKIVSQDCFLFCGHKENLPMVSPSFDRWAGTKINVLGSVDANNRDFIRKADNQFNMESGGILGWHLDSEKDTFPSQQGDTLYIIGNIRYVDNIESFRSIFFARRYIPGGGRFEAVKDPDYERQD